MKIISAKLFSYSLPLRQPLKLKKFIINSRDGLVIELKDDQDHVAFGEIAPLPGFSNESLDEATKQAAKLIQELSGKEFSDSKEFGTDYVSELNNYRLASSVCFGLEMALFYLAAKPDSSARIRKIKVNGLITTLNDQTITQALALQGAGYGYIKLKVGRGAIATETRIIRELSQALGPHVTLRLDGNRGFDFDSASHFCDLLKDCSIGYFEEPLADPSRLSELGRNTGIPVALDESLCEPDGETKISEPAVGAIVIKPTLVGGLKRTMQLAQVAQECSKQISISSAYESSLGLTCLAELAYRVAPESAHGLGTLDSFQTQLTEPALVIDSGYLTLPEEATLAPKRSLLGEVE